MDATWKPVVGYEGLYEVSDTGFVKSRRCIVAPWKMQNWRRDGANRKPWGQPRLKVSLNKDGKQRHHKVHVLVLTAFVGPRPAGMQCRHLDGDCKNNRLENLRWGTREENVQDGFRLGEYKFGEKCVTAKLTWNDVRYIRSAEAMIYSQGVLARRFGVSQSAIAAIQSGRTWKKEC